MVMMIIIIAVMMIDDADSDAERWEWYMIDFVIDDFYSLW